MSFDKPNMKRRGFLMVPVALASLGVINALSGCAVQERVVVVEHPNIRPMPAVIHEERGTPPGYGWNWVPGHWKWEGHDWFWVHGKWVQEEVPPMPAVIVEQVTVAPSPRHYWVPGHWVWAFEGHRGWVWVHGGWRD